MLVILFPILFPSIYLLYVYNPYYVLDYFDSIKENETELSNIINNISQTFSEAYAYNEISKNPPQPYFDNNYHNKVDIQELLSKINLTRISFYEFYRKLTQIISELKDLHINIYFNNHTLFHIMKNLYAICPIKFEIIKVNNEYQIVCKLNKYSKYYNDKITDLIQNNYDKKVYIESINNLSPFNFIDNFCGNIGKTKNPHGSFSHKFNAHYGYNLAVFPLNKQNLKLEILYNNGDKIYLEYIFLSTSEIPQLIHKDNNKNVYVENYLFNEYMEKRTFENYNYNHKFKLGKLQKEFNKYMNISEKKKNNNQNKKEIQWDYQYNNKIDDILKCRTDELNKVNVYFIQSFSNNNNTLYKELFLNCVSLFDKNDYPIIVILNKNNGGYSDLSKLMLELISPFVSISKYLSTKIYKKLSNENHIIEVNYGENITGYLTNPIEDLIWLNDEIIEYKKNLRNKRKPTDILIFTDGYSFSAAATFIKYLQYYGGGIVAGYFGNPKLNDIPFDSGQSSSSVFNNDILYFISNSYKILNEKYNISMDMPGNQNFFDDLNLSRPLEYLITPVDERVNIFHHYKDVHYELFINEALKIFNKYKKRCNSNNKKLVLMNEKYKKEKEISFGGNECDNDGFWSDKYVKLFCDVEYVFNHHLNKCVIRKREINIIILFKILLAIVFFCTIFVLILYFFNNNKEEDSESNSGEELIDIYENN